MIVHDNHRFTRSCITHIREFMLCRRARATSLLIVLVFMSSAAEPSCPDTTAWGTPVQLSTSGDITSNIFVAGTSAGFMAVWVDDANNAHYSFSSNGATWQGGLISPAQGQVASTSDVFVAGNAAGFMVTWIDGSNDAWSSFSADNGENWSDALAINPNSLSLDSNSEVYVGGGAGGFVATMIGDDSNAYVSFSTGTAAWSTPVQVTSDNSVYNQNWNSQTTRGFINATIVSNSCMLAWITQPLALFSAYFSSINPFSVTSVDPIVNIGFFESVPSVAALNGYFMAVARANEGDGVNMVSVATITSNWATFSLVSPSPQARCPQTGPSVASNHAGFMSAWIVGENQNDPGSPVWMLSNNNGFNWTPVCSIVQTPSTTITGPLGLSANTHGFVATWLDTNDSNAYASFYWTPPSAGSTSNDLFVTLLQQKYGPLLGPI